MPDRCIKIMITILTIQTTEIPIFFKKNISIVPRLETDYVTTPLFELSSLHSNPLSITLFLSLFISTLLKE